MAITAEEKVAYFEPELRRIYDKKVREFTRLCVTQAPDYFFEDCPSSSSGKFHPIDEMTFDGSIIHTKKVFTMAWDMVKALDCEQDRDVVLSACIIHDLRKQGPTYQGHNIHEHPDWAAKLVDEVQEATMLLTEEQYKYIRNAVGYHYGPWSDDPWKKNIKDYNMVELAVFLSDFVVSKKYIATDYRRAEW